MSINHRSFSEYLHSPRIPVKEIVLKEWAVVANAIEQGEQLILFRRGGLVEETKEFRLEDTSFYLYPTLDQQNARLIKEAYMSGGQSMRAEKHQQLQGKQTIGCLVHVTDEIEVSDAHVLKKLSPYHIFTDEYAIEHLRWHKTRRLYILIVRAYRLSKPVTIPIVKQYDWFSSWMKLECEIHDVDCIPVLSDSEFHRKRQDILKRVGLDPLYNRK